MATALAADLGGYPVTDEAAKSAQARFEFYLLRVVTDDWEVWGPRTSKTDGSTYFDEGSYDVLGLINFERYVAIEVFLSEELEDPYLPPILDSREMFDQTFDVYLISTTPERKSLLHCLASVSELAIGQ